MAKYSKNTHPEQPTDHQGSGSHQINPPPYVDGKGRLPESERSPVTDDIDFHRLDYARGYVTGWAISWGIHVDRDKMFHSPCDSPEPDIWQRSDEAFDRGVFYGMREGMRNYNATGLYMRHNYKEISWKRGVVHGWLKVFRQEPDHRRMQINPNVRQGMIDLHQAEEYWLHGSSEGSKQAEANFYGATIYIIKEEEYPRPAGERGAVTLG